jgi:hypothetical protein
MATWNKPCESPRVTCEAAASTGSDPPQSRTMMRSPDHCYHPTEVRRPSRRAMARTLLQALMERMLDLPSRAASEPAMQAGKLSAGFRSTECAQTQMLLGKALATTCPRADTDSPGARPGPAHPIRSDAKANKTQCQISMKPFPECMFQSGNHCNYCMVIESVHLRLIVWVERRQRNDAAGSAQYH